MAGESVEIKGVLLDQLGARFELVLEAVTGFGLKLEGLRDEVQTQLAEVGRQIRFLSDQIAENRRHVLSFGEGIGAEVVRLAEALGKSRVEAREYAEASQRLIREEVGRAHDATRAALNSEITEIISRIEARRAETRPQITETARAGGRENWRTGASRQGREGGTSDGAMAEAAEATRRIEAELKRTHKILSDLNRKFGRLDDRVTIQSKDHEQRLKKLERASNG